MKKFFSILAVLLLALYSQAVEKFEGKAMWAHPGDFGKSEKEVEEFFRLLKKCNINLIVPLVKSTDGTIFWHSKKFPQAINPDYKDFDLLKALTKYARLYNIKLHAWLCDFPEGKNSPAFKLHPEWAMLNPQGGMTSEEKLGGAQPYGTVWMCPARRPGYTDQWLLPMIEEVVKDYDVDGIHHDYVRYPGDVAPDTYCFCDYCLENYLTYNHQYYLNRPNDQISLKRTRPRQGANWDLDFTAKPAGWSEMSREQKADFLLNGKLIDRNDMDYFFYETRCDAITRFVREAREIAQKVKPGTEFSSAVFINPMRSGRFIGQRWTDFVHLQEVMMPMDYRSHFQGSFEDYLAYLEDTIMAQKNWVGGKSKLYVGIAGYYLYREEMETWDKAIEILTSGAGVDERKQELKRMMEANIAYLKKYSPEKAVELEKKYNSFLRQEVQKEALIDAVRKILADPPPGFFSEEKLLKTMETVRNSGTEGIVIFAGGFITRAKLWPALEKSFLN